MTGPFSETPSLIESFRLCSSVRCTGDKFHDGCCFQSGYKKAADVFDSHAGVQGAACGFSLRVHVKQCGKLLGEDKISRKSSLGSLRILQPTLGNQHLDADECYCGCLDDETSAAFSSNSKRTQYLTSVTGDVNFGAAAAFECDPLMTTGSWEHGRSRWLGDLLVSCFCSRRQLRFTTTVYYQRSITSISLTSNAKRTTIESRFGDIFYEFLWVPLQSRPGEKKSDVKR
ncbi:uncharacterized protein V6R79_024954 [Siganus canaliculatus]